MRHVNAQLWISLAVLVALLGCGGGGGGGGSSGSTTSQDDAAARDQAFADEAVERVLDRTTVTCEDVSCTGDAVMSIVTNETLGTVTAICGYICLPVEIDMTEVRHYDVRLLWRRSLTTCFDATDFMPFILAQVPVPCVPTQ